MQLAKTVLVIAISLVVSSPLYADHHEGHQLIGVWNAKASMDGNERDITWTFKKDGDRITGTSHDHENGDDREVDRIKVEGKKVTLEIDIEQDGNKGVIKVIADLATSRTLDGKWSIVGDDGQEYMSGDVEAQKEVAFAGEWAATAELPDGAELESVVEIKGANKSLSGVIHGENGDLKLETVKATKKGLRCTFDYNMDGTDVPIVIETELKDENKLVGEWSTEDGEYGGKWSAVRKVETLAGEWAMTAEVEDSEDYEGVLVIKGDAGSFTGTATTNGEDTKLKSITVDGKELTFTVPFEQDGASGIVEVKAKQNDSGELVGEWVLTDDGAEYARGKWEASRK